MYCIKSLIVISEQYLYTSESVHAVSAEVTGMPRRQSYNSLVWSLGALE